MSSSVKRIPQVVLFGIGNHHAILQKSRHNIGAIILQQYMNEMTSKEGLKCISTGKNAFKFENLSVNEKLLLEFKEKTITRLKKKHQIENPNVELSEEEIEMQLVEKLHDFCPQPVVDLHILLPSTAMNVSGNVIRSYCDLHHIYYKRKDRLMILYDDLDLPFGTFKMKERSGDAGHNGIKDIEKKLGTNRFSRLKIGIHPPDRSAIITGRDFVLSNFNYEELKLIQGSLYEKIFENCLLGFPHLDEGSVMQKTNSI